ncbi:MAG: hypothetical protein WCF26_12800 [Candidatus Sulfotelmatobacter sp.]
MAVSPDIRKRLLYAKYLLSRAKKDQNDRNELAVAACLLLMHDATELLMLAGTDHLGIGSNWKFMEFWEKVKQSGHKEPGHKTPMSQLNDMRVSLKHKGILPRPQSVRDLFPRVEIFCEEVSKDLLGLDFGDLSLADLVADDEVRNALRDATQALSSGDKNQAFINVRIAFDELHRLISQDVPLIDEPRRLRSSKSEIPSDAMDDLYTLYEGVKECVETLNVSMLGIDPIRYTFFINNTPHISWTVSGLHQTTLSRDYNNMPDEVFQTCFEFVVDVALNASR